MSLSEDLLFDLPYRQRYSEDIHLIDTWKLIESNSKEMSVIVCCVNIINRFNFCRSEACFIFDEAETNQ